MSTIVQHKRSEVVGSAPSPEDFSPGELALNLADGKIYSKNSSGSVVQMISYDSDLFTVPDAVDLGYITDGGSVYRDMGFLV